MDKWHKQGAEPGWLMKCPFVTPKSHKCKVCLGFWQQPATAGRAGAIALSQPLSHLHVRPVTLMSVLVRLCTFWCCLHETSPLNSLYFTLLREMEEMLPRRQRHLEPDCCFGAVP